MTNNIRNNIYNGNTQQHISWHNDVVIKQFISYAVGCIMGRYRQFISIYGLEDELSPDVPLDEITILQQGEISITED